MINLATLKLVGWASLGLVIASLFLALHLERSQNAKLKAQLHECSDARQQLADKSKVQQKTITTTVDHYVKVTVPEVEKRARVIEQAPVNGCETPKEVLDADV